MLNVQSNCYARKINNLYLYNLLSQYFLRPNRKYSPYSTFNFLIAVNKLGACNIRTSQFSICLYSGPSFIRKLSTSRSLGDTDSDKDRIQKGELSYARLSLEKALKEYKSSRDNSESFKLLANGVSSPSPSLRSEATDNLVNALNRSLEMTPRFITGFSDAEASFMINLVKASKLRIGWNVVPIFQIELHQKDLELLKLIQAYFLRNR